MMLPDNHHARAAHGREDRAAQPTPCGDRAAHPRPRDDRAWSSELRLESAYLPTALALSFEAPGAHAVALLVDGDLEREAARARLVSDPNVCELDASGARVARTHLAPRSQPVALTRLRAEDPATPNRTRFAITGAGLRDGLTLVVSGRGARFHLELGGALASLHRRGRAPSTAS